MIKGEEQIKKLEHDWQATCDALIDEQQKSKSYISKLEDKEESLQMDLAKLKSEHYQLVSEHSERTQQIKEEMENSVNYEYVKNILVSYFMTNDIKVHENLLRVIFLALRFSPEEQQKVIDAWTANNQSLMGKMIGGFF